MDTLYAAPGSTSLVAAILLEECEHPYTLELMDLFKDGAGGAAYAQLNPWRQVPALHTSHGLVTETLAIAEYLDHAHPERRLWPAVPWHRIQALRWYACLSSALQPYVRCIVRPERFVGNDAERASSLREHVARLLVEKLTLVDAELGERSWLAGDEFGPADALLVTMTGWVQHMRLPVASLDQLRDHTARCRARPAFQRAIERHGAVPQILRTSSREAASASRRETVEPQA